MASPYGLPNLVVGRVGFELVVAVDVIPQQKSLGTYQHKISLG